MEILSNLGLGFHYVLNWVPLLVISLGVIFGILAGAMPGLSPSMGVALLVPFTYTLDPTLALILLVAIYISANYGGSITAVTINAPGTPAAVVTSFDGYPLTLQGKPTTGLGFSLVASTVGGIIGTLILIFFSVPLAKVAIKFHPAEYFALAIFGLTTVASLGGRNWIKAFITALFGLLISTIGIDPISGVSRFTFGISQLDDGFALIPALIGLFTLSEVFRQLEEFKLSTGVSGEISSHWPKFIDYWKQKFTILRSSIIGTLIGIFPGAGATIASFISYDIAKRTSKEPEKFGKGSLEGVSSAQAACSGSVGGALVPLLTLGIPGSASAAVLIGALMIHGLNPGPQLFNKKPEMIFGIFASLIIANILIFVFGLFGSKLWIKVTEVPKKILFPLIFAVSIIGSFAVRFSFFDVASCLGFGIIGWLLRRNKFPVAPIVLGIVLGNIAETNFRQAVMMGGYAIFFKRIASLLILLLAFFSLVIPIIKMRKVKK
ncbi:MAG: C4-dicarboxylate ABC transporter permease [Candidatus Cloacimonadota bacterium]|nr:MAG: C4-dicarboxylate ABC transporter permease [Candidatus Cloacimonadota bacterium]